MVSFTLHLRGSTMLVCVSWFYHFVLCWQRIGWSGELSSPQWCWDGRERAPGGCALRWWKCCVLIPWPNRALWIAGWDWRPLDRTEANSTESRLVKPIFTPVFESDDFCPGISETLHLPVVPFFFFFAVPIVPVQRDKFAICTGYIYIYLCLCVCVLLAVLLPMLPWLGCTVNVSLSDKRSVAVRLAEACWRTLICLFLFS